MNILKEVMQRVVVTGQDEMEADDSLWYSNKPCLCEQMIHFENWPKVCSSNLYFVFAL